MIKWPSNKILWWVCINVLQLWVLIIFIHGRVMGSLHTGSEIFSFLSLPNLCSIFTPLICYMLLRWKELQTSIVHNYNPFVRLSADSCLSYSRFYVFSFKKNLYDSFVHNNQNVLVIINIAFSLLFDVMWQLKYLTL